MNRARPFRNDFEESDFSFLYPESYTQDGRNVLVLLTGSNQESFETGLNSTYRRCLRYVQPLTPAQAECIIQKKGWNLTRDDTLFYYNNVPREMRELSLSESADQYVAERKDEMSASLGLKVDKLPDKGPAAQQLEHLFKMRGMHGATIPFQDLGLVYRKRNPVTHMLDAFPLCRPAEMALLESWRRIRPVAVLKTLTECIN